ncbi:MAG TPA: endo alpha-1,4 polygalactosaminidase [Cellulomonas sp.]
MRRARGVLAGAAVLTMLAACSGGGDAPGGTAGTGSVGSTAAPATSPTAATAAAGLPPTGAVVDYQLGGGYLPADGVGGVVRDSTGTPEAGMWSGCYVNGFQTQPGDRDLWLDQHPDLVLRDADGTPVADPAWPDEMLLDLSTAEKRAAIAEVLGESILACAASGFDAVELDNLDSYTRSDGRVTEDEAIDLAARYVAIAHQAGLAVAQKNSAELGTRGRDEAGFDFAVAEECQRWDECAAYTDVYGDAVLDIEYDDDLDGTWAQVCADPQVPTSTILRDRGLSTPDDADYVFDRC